MKNTIEIKQLQTAQLDYFPSLVYKKNLVAQAFECQSWATAAGTPYLYSTCAGFKF
jgi:hypothetical protein